MKRIINIVFLIVCFAMLLIPLALTNTEEGAVSDVDGRTLIAKPVFGADGYQAGMEAWLRDRLGLRDDIVVVHAVANDKLLGELISPHYQYGKDGYTFGKLHNNIDFGSYHIYFADMVADIQRYCESRGTRFYYVFNPEKESVYREYLPAGVNYSDEWADKMLSYMDKRGINYIDLRGALKEAREKAETKAAESDKSESVDEAVFGHVFDAGHWNHRGAFYGMQELTKVMHRENSKIPVLDENEYDITTTIAEKNYGSNQIINAEIPSYTLKAGYEDETGDLATEVKRDPESTYFQLIRNNSKKAGGIDRLLLFEDDLWAPFAFSRARETAVVGCLKNTINFDYYYNIFKPDVVVFENMEYVVNDTYFKLDAMKAAEQNPAVLANYPEEDFAERRDELLVSTEEYEFESNPRAVLMPGNAVDRVYLSSGLLHTKYAYLITNDRVIDLKRNAQGALEASIRHGDLKIVGSGEPEDDDVYDEYDESSAWDYYSSEGLEPGYVTLYTISENGEHRYATIPIVTDLTNIANMRDGSTENAIADEAAGTYTMTTKTEGNVFSYTTLQLHEKELTGFLGALASSGAAGRVDGSYCHREKTGDYALLLRAGTNLADEWVPFNVHLVKGQSYWFSYNVDELSPGQVVMSNFSFSEPAADEEEEYY